MQLDPGLTAQLSGRLVPGAVRGQHPPRGRPPQHLPGPYGANHQPFVSLLLPRSSIYLHY